MSEAYIDKAIADRRAGINAGNREEMISLHMSQPVTAEKIITGMPMLSASGTQVLPPAGGDDSLTELNAEQQGVEIARRAKAYQAEQSKAGNPIDYAAAVQHIAEKKK